MSKKRKYHVNEDLTYKYLKQIIPLTKIKKQYQIIQDIIFEGVKIQSKVIIDFYFILNNKEFFIEYNGKQHYEPIKRFGGKKAFIKRQKRDQWVRQYCKDNNITLIEIDGRIYQKDLIKGFLSDYFEKLAVQAAI